MATLIVQNGKHQGTKIPLPQTEVSVGRDDKCYIRLTSAEVSRVHCTLQSTVGGVLVKDMGSQNGVLINGTAIQGSQTVHPGDQLKIGPIKFTVEVPQLARPTGGRGGGADDDSIANWLAESDTGVISSSTSDTKEINTHKADHSDGSGEETEEQTTSGSDGKTIAEEAQEIIRRHFEMKEKK